MDQKAPVYKQHITVQPANSSENPDFRWMVLFKSLDHKKERLLGYRACGTVKNDLTGLQFEEEPQVHDADRPVWTTMPTDHRIDIRKQIIALAVKACKIMKDSGKSNFERIIE